LCGNQQGLCREVINDAFVAYFNIGLMLKMDRKYIWIACSAQCTPGLPPPERLSLKFKPSFVAATISKNDQKALSVIPCI
jgi:hypothetical protein